MSECIEWARIVPCPEQKMDVNAEDCVGCDYYEETDTNRECIVCNFREKSGDSDD